jgi:hypothetical protein
MKKAIFLFATACIATNLWAQTSYDYAKRVNDYPKKTLRLNKPATTVEIDDLNFSIITVEGNTKSRLVTIEILIKNKGTKTGSFFLESKFDN